jgi:hypothetical protein
MLPALLVVNRGQRRRDMAAVVKAAGTAVGAKRVVIGLMADRGHADADQIVGEELPTCGRWPTGPVLWSPSSVTLPAKARPFAYTRGIYC